jgi:hypothetical protein
LLRIRFSRKEYALLKGVEKYITIFFTVCNGQNSNTMHYKFYPKIIRIALFLISIGTCVFKLQAQAVHDVQMIDEIPQAFQKNQTMIRTADGGYFIITPFDNGIGSAKLMCYKLNADLTQAWTQASEYLASNAMITATDVAQCPDGGYIVCGNVLDETLGFSSGYLLRLDASGNTQWFRRYTDNLVRWLNGVTVTSEGFITVGAANSLVYGSDGIILCTDQDGNPRWSTRVLATKYVLGYRNATALSQVIRLRDDTYATVGTTNVVLEESDAVVVVFDNQGTITGNWVYGDDADLDHAAIEEGAAIKYNPDEDALVMTGRAMRSSATVCSDVWYADVWVWKINAIDGIVQWSNRYNILNTPDEVSKFPYPKDLDFDNTQIGVAGVGQTLVGPGMYTDNSFICRIDQSGAMFNNRNYVNAADNSLHRIIRTPSQSFVAAGQTKAIGGVNQLKLMESYDNIIEYCEMEELPYDQVDFPLIVRYADLLPESPQVFDLRMEPLDYPANEYTICDRQLGADGIGKTKPGANQQVWSATERNSAFGKNSLRFDTPGIVPAIDGSSIVMYPNPANSIVNLHFNLVQNSHVLISVSNVLGRSVLIPIDKDLKVGNQRLSFSITDLSNGVYTLTVQSDSKVWTQKLNVVR